jgi:hypothetical protein
MNISFNEKRAIFSLASTTEYERGLLGYELKLLKDIYCSCDEKQKEELKMDAYSVCEKIMEN